MQFLPGTTFAQPMSWTFLNLHCLHLWLPPSCLLFPLLFCLIPALISTLPYVNKWNILKPLAELFTVSGKKKNSLWFIFTSFQKLETGSKILKLKITTAILMTGTTAKDLFKSILIIICYWKHYTQDVFQCLPSCRHILHVFMFHII